MAAQGTFNVRLIPGDVHGGRTENIHVHYYCSRRSSRSAKSSTRSSLMLVCPHIPADSISLPP